MGDHIVVYCPCCGETYVVKVGEISTCDTCNKALLVEFGDQFKWDDYDLDIQFSPENEAAIEALVKASPEFDQAAWDRRVRIENGEEPDPSYVPTPVCRPKCPTCGSTNIRRIGGVERAGSVLAWGLLSRKINKTFECLNCHYRW